MTVQDVRGSHGRSILHYAAWLVIVSMQYATLDHIIMVLSSCVQGYHLQTMISVNLHSIMYK